MTWIERVGDVMRRWWSEIDDYVPFGIGKTITKIINDIDTAVGVGKDAKYVYDLIDKFNDVIVPLKGNTQLKIGSITNQLESLQSTYFKGSASATANKYIKTVKETSKKAQAAQGIAEVYEQQARNYLNEYNALDQLARTTSLGTDLEDRYKSARAKAEEVYNNINKGNFDFNKVEKET